MTRGISFNRGDIRVYFCRMPHLLFCKDKRGRGSAGKRKNVSEITVICCFEKQAVSDCGGRAVSVRGGALLYGRNADALYYFTYVEGNQALFSTYSLFIIIPSIIGAACFPMVFRLTNNKGRSASLFALLTGISMFCMYFFTVGKSPVPFYLFSCLAQFFFSGFNTAIYAIVPDCVEYGEWKTGLRNDGFQYAFISLGNKIGMAIGTSVLAGVLGSFGYVANQQQNPAVLAVIKHSFTTVPGVLWIITAAVLFFYRLNKKAYNKIVREIQERKENEKNE